MGSLEWSSGALTNLSDLKYVTGASKIVLIALSVFHETAVRLGYNAGVERYIFASAIDQIHDYTDPGIDLKKICLVSHLQIPAGRAALVTDCRSGEEYMRA